MRILSFFLFLFLVNSQAAPSGYKLVFNEDFNTLSVSNWGATPPKRWIAHTPYGGDFGDAWFTGPDEPPIPSPFSISQGHLIITAWKDKTSNHWRSGLLSSISPSKVGFAQALGYFECRMQLPKGLGVWPAFWLVGINGLDQSRINNVAEIDILEAYGVDITVAHQLIHVWTPQGADIWAKGNARKLLYNPSDRYRVYACLVKKDFITFYVDGTLIWQTPTPKEALEPLYVMVDLALGGGWPIDQTPDPSRLLVDYVRVYAP